MTVEIGIWAQPIVSLACLGGAAGWRFGRGQQVPPGPGPALLVGVASAWLVAETLNLPLRLWRYTLLPSAGPLQWVWLLLLWVPGVMAVALMAGGWMGTSARAWGPWIRMASRSAAWALVWASALIAAGSLAVPGVRLNPVWPGGCAGSGLAMITGVAFVLGCWQKVAPALTRADPRILRGGYRDLLALALLAAANFAAAPSISSTTPTIRDLPGVLPSDAEALQLFGYPTVTALARATVEEVVAQVPVLSVAQATETIEGARLALRGGMGTRWARVLWGQDVRSVDALMGLDAPDVEEKLRGGAGGGAPEPWVRGWIQGCGSFLAVEFRDADFHP